MKKALTILLMALLIFPVLSPDARALPADQEGFQTQTIMVYIIGSDLESDGGMGTSDIREMLKAKPDKNRLNVLVMTGGTNKWQSGAIPADRLSVYKIEGLNPKPVQAWEKGSMGEPAALTRFLDFARENYPAESYGLILWDHGGGPMVGFGMDTAYKGDGLTLPELREALEQSAFKDDSKLEWLAFDACLMASLEVAALLSPYARYMIASQEALPGYGFDYAFLKSLSSSGLTGTEAGRAIIDHTYAYYEALSKKNPEFQMPVTLSLTDLGQAAPVQEKLDGLFSNLDLGLQAGIYSDIARSRDKTKDYGRTTTTNAYDLIDLLDFSMNMEALYPERAGELDRAIGDMVLYNRSNAPRTNGVSLYFPLRNKDMFKTVWGELYKAFDIAPAYKRFMESFARILLADSLSSWTGADEPAVTLDEQTGEYFIQLSPEQINNYDRAEYYILARLRGEEYMLTFMSGDVTLDADGRLRPNFGGKIVYIEDENGANRIVPHLMEKENIGGIAYYHIPVVLSGSETEGESFSAGGNLLVQIDKEHEEASLTGAIRDSAPDSLMGKQDVDLSQWSLIHLFHGSSYLARDEAGALLPYGDWSSASMPIVTTYSAKGGLKVSYDPIDETLYDYFVLMSIIDTQGYVYSSELMPLKADPPQNPPAAEKPLYEVSYAQGGSARFIAEHMGIGVTLMGIEQTPETPASLKVYLMLQSSLAQEAGVSLEWASADGVMMNSSGSASIPAGDSALMSFDLPIGSARARDIRFGLLVNDDVVNSLGWTALNMTGLSQEFMRLAARMGNWVSMGEVRVQTDFSLPSLAQPAEDPAFEPRLLWEGEGITIEQAGLPSTDGTQLEVPLKITNRSKVFDLVQLEKSAVNGIMAGMTMPERVQPGSVLYATARVDMKRVVLPPEYAEFQGMMDMIENLETLGIRQVRDITLRFALDSAARLGSAGRDAVRRLTDYVTLTLPGMEGYEQPLDQAGEEIFTGYGVRAVRLSSDPAGRTFYIENSGKTAVRVDTFGHTRVDGESYGENIPLYAEVFPGSAAYARLFDYIPTIEPQAKEISFYISVIDMDENRLLGRSAERITLTLPTGE